MASPEASGYGAPLAQRKESRLTMNHVAISSIEFDPCTQIRVDIDAAKVAEYAEAMRDGDRLPPVDLFRSADGGAHYIGDGWHRLLAAQHNGDVTIAANVFSGGRTEAIKFALSANSRHGIQRTNSDKRKAARVALREFPKLSDAELARMCAISDKTVASVRHEQTANLGTSEVETRIGADGKERKLPAKPAAMQHEPRVHAEEQDDETSDRDTQGGKPEQAAPIGGSIDEIEAEAAKVHRFFNAESWAKQTRTLMEFRMAEAVPSARADCAEEMLRIAQAIWAKHQPKQEAQS